MSSKNAQNFNEDLVLGNEIEEEIKEEQYDTMRFMSPDCQCRYYDNFLDNKIKPKRGIDDVRLTEFLPDFYGQLEATGWTHFIPTQCED